MLLARLRRFFQNPIVLREIGWAYSPPVFGRIPRRRAQAAIALGIVLVLAGFALWAESKIRDGGIYVLFFAALMWALALLVRSIISSLNAWSKERDRQKLEELILTRLSPEEIAEAKVFARGFHFIAGGWIVAFLGLAGLSLGLARGTIPGEEIAVFALMFLTFPPIITNLYLRMLRAGLRGRFAIFRVLLSLILWLGVVPLAQVMLAAFLLYSMDELADVPHQAQGIVELLAAYIGMQTLAMWCFVMVAYRRLTAEVQLAWEAILGDA
ncbi:MAG: hypothetical protein RLY93_14270 [Sumerlaeia bacterium]